MIMHAKLLLPKKWRGYQRQGPSEISAPEALYAVDFRRNEEKSAPSFWRLRRQTASLQPGKNVHEANGKKIT
jgi:hypothetical protein